MAFEVSIVSPHDNLERIVDDINTASWDEANEITAYDVQSLTTYLKHQDTLFIVCYDNTPTIRVLMGLLELADEADCEEVWLGTEVDNVAANALYSSLKPDDVETFIGYTYEMDE